MTDMDFRQYDPALGRFVVPDPMAEFQRKWSPYHFAFDNPVLYNDPTGLEGEDISKKKYDKDPTVDGGALKEVVVKGHKKSTASSVVNFIVDVTPFVGSIKQLGMGIYHGDTKEIALGAIFLTVDAFTLGEGGEALKLAEMGAEEALKIAAEDEAKELVEHNLDEIAESAVNGNSALNEKAQHLYEIFEVGKDGKAGNVVKTGISGGKIGKNGSYRAISQANKWSKGEIKYATRIKQLFPGGPGARAAALQAEKANAKLLRLGGQLKDITKHAIP
jgi:hypothetical protein